MNNFLLTRNQIEDSTKWLVSNGYTSHPISAKDWELSQVIERIGDGDLVDLGADGSFVLHNAIRRGIKGRKVGIDLIEVVGGNAAEGAEYFKGDLMHTPFEDNSFDTVVCLSVIEHDVKYDKIAKEVGRLLRSGGNVFISFDTWTPKPDTSLTKLYSLDWNILDVDDIKELVKQFSINGMELTSEIDWTLEDAVINPTYCSPAPVSYTFGILNFIKK